MAGEFSDHTVVIKWMLHDWSDKEYILSVEKDGTVADLKKKIKDAIGLLPERQELCGLRLKNKTKRILSGGKPPGDDVCLKDLKLKPTTKIRVMRKLDKVKEAQEYLTGVESDSDIEEEEISKESREEYLSKLDRHIKDYKINVLNEPRQGKKLLVLDIDKTLFDHRSVAETAKELMRPYLHEFLQSAYEDYDIVIWSATGMDWVEVKMKELGVTSNPNYKICFMLDRPARISVHTPKYGIIEAKALGVIWGKYEQWSAKNTIMFDDIRRNFIMNPQTGLRVCNLKCLSLLHVT
ncbi:ubiquitin-like domain-containing CTD phosphatase 1 [Saccostrea cucullata]|uniref:ubiquitin-like domain-containing CTD phosphatase 1 n=1 Tax=Saccostrea cuccullata TaxID=36930 RepID=UPI002ED32EBA